MKILKNKNLTQKIIIAIVIIISFNFMAPTYSRAWKGSGLLTEPVADLVLTIGDTILSLLQGCMYNGSIADGLSNIINGNAHFVFLRENGWFPEMEYDNSNGEKEHVTIQSSELDKISLFDISLFIGNIPAGIINLGTQLMGLQSTYDIPTIQYTTDKIFSNKVPAFDVNYINPKQYEDDNMMKKSIANQLREIIASWYTALRNLAIVGLLSVLLYVGIRMMFTSVSSDKAKYKQMLMDWIVALCLLFFLHYIMSFTMTMIELINESIAETSTEIPVEIIDSGLPDSLSGVLTTGETTIRFNTDLMGLCRLQVQYSDFTRKITYLILYIGLIVYTVKYTWIYLKRTITMAFLTLMAPLVALTYPIDKISDGKAQAFNMWLKEYIFTALLQPFHLIIYTVLLGSAINIVTVNPIYAILVLAFMGPAETMLRKFFGFDKASTPGSLSQAGAMFGGAAAFNTLKKISSSIAKSASGGSGDGNNSIRTNDNPIEDDNAPDGYDAFANTTNNLEHDEQEMAEEDFERQYGDSRQQIPTQEMAEEDFERQYGNNRQQIPTQEMAEEDFERQYGDNDDNNSLNNSRESTSQQIGTARRLLNARNAARHAATNYVTDGLRRKFRDKEARMRTLKNVAKTGGKFVGKLAVAGTMGMIGIGMGIAGNDLEDVLTFGVGGTLLGASVAPALGRKISNSKMGRTISNAVREEYYGGVNQAQIAKQTEEQYNSGVIREEMAEDFTDENGRRVQGKELDKLEDRGIELYNNGFTERSERKKVMKMEKSIKNQLNRNLSEEEREDKSKKMAETIGKIARDIKPDKLSDEKYVNGKLNEFRKGIKRANNDLTDRDVDNNAQQMVRLIKDYYKKP